MRPQWPITERVRIEESGCWTWLGPKCRDGYGRISYMGQSFQAHRFAYEAFVGEIPKDFDIDHLCFVTDCCNPKHLRPLDHLTNSKLQRSSFKTHCKNGHPLSGDNLYVRTEKCDGARGCRKCNCEAAKRLKQRKKLAKLSQASDGTKSTP